MKINDLLKETLKPDEDAPLEINRQILREYRKVDTMKNSKTKKRKFNMPKLATAICALVLLCSATTFAAIKYFTPSEVANAIEDKALAKVFGSDTAVTVNETQSFKNYTVTFLGTVSGDALADFVAENDSVAGEIANGKTYAVTAIENTDGSPMPSITDDAYDETTFLVSPYIKGENPLHVNLFSMNGSASTIVKDGIMYRISEWDNIEIFADRGVYLGVTSSFAPDMDAYIWNEADGTLTPNKDYDGVNALFTLPLDKEKADPKAAKEYLDALKSEAEGYISDSEKSETCPIKLITPEEIAKNYILLEDSVKVVTPDSDGMITYFYETENGNSFRDQSLVSALFPDNKPGIANAYTGTADDTHKWVTTYELMEDGTVTVRTYQEK